MLVLIALVPAFALLGRQVVAHGPLAFPKGSALTLTATLLKALQRKQPSVWNLDLEFDLIWPLPGPGELEDQIHRGHELRRRQRRDVYQLLESAFDSHALPGRQCVLRAICEANSLRVDYPGVSLVADLLAVIFSYPAEDGTWRGSTCAGTLSEDNNSDSNDDEYGRAHLAQEGVDDVDRCGLVHPCPFSLMQLLLFGIDQHGDREI